MIQRRSEILKYFRAFFQHFRIFDKQFKELFFFKINIAYKKDRRYINKIKPAKTESQDTREKFNFEQICLSF